MRSVLFVTQVALPSTLVAARRVGGFAKCLGRADHDVTGLSSLVSGTGPIEGASAAVRTNDLMLAPLNWRRRHFRAFAGEAGGSTSHEREVCSTSSAWAPLPPCRVQVAEPGAGAA